MVDNLIESSAEKSYGLFREFHFGNKVQRREHRFALPFDPHLAPDDPVNSSFGYETGVEWPGNEGLFSAHQDVPKFQTCRLSMFAAGDMLWASAGSAPRLSVDYAYSHAVRADRIWRSYFWSDVVLLSGLN